MKQKEITKLICLALMPILATMVGWLLLDRAFAHLQFELAVPTLNTLWYFLSSLVLLLLGLAAFSVVAVLEQRYRLSLALTFILPLILLIILGINVYTLIGAGIYLVGLVQLALKVQEERNERLKVSMNKYMRYGLGLAISAMLLAISISFYGAAVGRGTERLDPIDVLSRLAANGVNQALTIQIPGYKPDITLDEFMLLVFATQFKEAEAAAETETIFGINITDIMGDVGDISPEAVRAILPADFEERVKDEPGYLTEIYAQVRNELIIQQLFAARNELLKNFHIEADGNDQISSVIEKILWVKLNDIFKPFKYLIPPILALTLYFALQIFGLIYSGLTRFFGILLFQMLKISKFFKVEEETTKGEIIKLS